MESSVIGTQPPSKQRRRWLRFSMRTLLVFMSIAGAGFAWLRAELHEVIERRQTIRAVKRLGGVFSVFDPVIGDGSVPSSQWEPLREWLGHEFTWKVSAIHLNSPSVSDNDLASLPKMRSVHSVYIQSAQVTDAGLRHLARYPELTQLDLTGTQVTDAGLSHLRQIPHLYVLILDNTQITDSGLSELRNLPELLGLGLSGTRITDNGVESLQEVTTLQWLFLDGTQVTEDGNERIARALPNCQIIVDPDPNWQGANPDAPWVRRPRPPLNLSLEAFLRM